MTVWDGDIAGLIPLFPHAKLINSRLFSPDWNRKGVGGCGCDYFIVGLSSALR
jgi:hypothetical protein